MTKRTKLAVGVAAALTVLAAAALLLRTGAVNRSALAAPATQGATADVGERVLFSPRPRRVWMARVPNGDDARPGGRARDAYRPGEPGVTVQNLGTRPTRILALSGPLGGVDALQDACARCWLTSTLCSAPVAPGATWHGDGNAFVSLSQQPARELGAAWAALPAQLGLPAAATAADVVCARAMAPAAGEGADCIGPALVDAILGGGDVPLLPGVPMAPAIGEPLGGVVAQIGQVLAPALPMTLDRYEALSAADIGWRPAAEDGEPTAGPLVYDLPGAWINSPDGLSSSLSLFNPGRECATAFVSAFRTSVGFRGQVTVTVPAGAWLPVEFDGRDGAVFQDVNGSATIRVSSDRPLAAALTVTGYNLSYTVPAVRMPDAALPAPTFRRLMPLAYQEKVEFAAAASVAGSVRVVGTAGAARLAGVIDGADIVDGVGSRAPQGVDQAPPDRARGWESNIAVFNPYADRLELAFRLQALGEPRREFAYPLVPRVQTVFQPGFGLGKPGGDGWGEMVAQPLLLPVPIAIHSVRMASDAPQFIEGWGVRAWPFDSAEPAPRFVGLPDLGGPAVASPDDPDAAPIALTGTMTDTYGGRIAVQNPLTRTARIAIDTYAPLCGYAGTLEQRIDARQRILVNVRDLPGVAAGANAAVVRVLDGAVAAVVEFKRPQWDTLAAAPVDGASAYLGSPIHGDGPQPEPLTARLAVTPTALTIDRAALTPLRVLVGHVPDDTRCARYTATADVPWLTVGSASGAIPAVLTLTIDPRRLPSGTATGVLTVSSADATIQGSPQRVTVTVTGEAVHRDPGLVYVPYVVRLVGR